MGDLTDGFNDLKELRKKRHETWFSQNMAYLNGPLCDLPFQFKSNVVLFRFEKLKVDFYPSTGRWREVGNTQSSRTHSGGAQQCVIWIKKELESKNVV